MSDFEKRRLTPPLSEVLWLRIASPYQPLTQLASFFIEHGKHLHFSVYFIQRMLPFSLHLFGSTQIQSSDFYFAICRKWMWLEKHREKSSQNNPTACHHHNQVISPQSRLCKSLLTSVQICCILNQLLPVQKIIFYPNMNLERKLLISRTAYNMTKVNLFLTYLNLSKYPHSPGHVPLHLFLIVS